MPLLASLFALSLAQAAPVEVPFRLGDDAIIVDAVVNGRKVSCMFDTGFSGTVVLNSAINIGPPTGTMTLRDFVGEFQATTVKVKTLKLGSQSIDTAGMEAVMQPLAHMSFSYNTHTDGIMGFEVIKKNITEISFQHGKFVFHPRTLDITKRVPDNRRTFLAKLLPIGHNSIEMEVLAPTGKKLTLALDTGNAFYATTHKDVLERVGLWPLGAEPKFMKLSGVASGTVESFYKRMSDMVIFGVPVKTSVWSIIDAPSSSAEGDGTVGFGFLKNFNIIIDYERRRVWLENFTGKVENEAVGDVGISAFPNPRTRRIQIVRVSPDSPAAKAGVREGDELLSIDGEEVLNVGFRQIERRLQGAPATKVRIAISRSGHLVRHELERVLLVND